MDPLTVVGVIANIAQLINLTAQIITYINGVKDAPKERAILLREITALLALLTGLRCMVEERRADPSLISVQSLRVAGGPLDQFKETLEKLRKELQPSNGILRFGKRLLWTLTKNEVDRLLLKIERLKGYIGLALQNDHFKLSLEIKSDLAEMSGYIQQTAKQTKILQQTQTENEVRDIIDWISSLDFSATQTDASARRQEGTGEWLLETEIFKEWLDDVAGTLWCPGLPGAGKTILVSTVVDYLEKYFGQEDTVVTYIYCNYKETGQNATDLIACLLKQVVKRGGLISPEIVLLYQQHVQSKTRPKLDEWSMLLRSEVLRYFKVFIVIDALDECTESDNTRDLFVTEIQKLKCIHLLVTSRPNPAIKEMLKQAACLEVCARVEDITRYTEGRIERDRRLMRFIKSDPALREAILKNIIEKSQGMFLLAQLYMDLLSKKLNRRDLRDALKVLPTELDEIYNKAMQRIRSQDKEEADLAERIICWISNTRRPLAVTEMQHCLATRSYDRVLDEDALPDEDDLVGVCAGLVIIDQKSNIIRLVHYTAEKYFQRFQTVPFVNAQANIAVTCLTYLSFDVFAEGYCSNDEEMERRLREYPFLGYAARYWGDHAREIQGRIVNELSLRFLEDNPKLMCANQILHLLGYRYPGDSQRFPKDITPLHVAVFFGLDETVRYLLEKGTKINAKDENGWTALHWAAENGYEMLARLLLEQGANINIRANFGGTPLHRAAKNGHDRVVQLLLDSNADAEVEDNYGGTALHRAARNGHETVVRLLVKSGMDVNRKYSLEAILDLLRHNGVAYARWVTENPKAKEFLTEGPVALLKEPGTEKLYGGTALGEAAENDRMVVAQFLLENDAIVDAEDGYGGTPLYRAVENGHEAMTRLLLDNGANVNKKDIFLPEVRMLLKQVSHSKISEKNGRTPLHEAADGGHDTIARLLLEKGADSSAKDKAGRTPLHLAAQKGHQGPVWLLLEMGASISAKDNLGQTALDVATAGRREEIVRLLQ